MWPCASRLSETHARTPACVSSLLQGCVLEEYSAGVEGKLRALELESIQDYIAESDNLVDLHQQVNRTVHAHSTHTEFLCACCGRTVRSSSSSTGA